jgi:gamma-glutamylaminecyclotransferase
LAHPVVLPAEVFTLFVYGTLMHDGCRCGVLAGQRCLGPARTRPFYDLLDLGAYPGLVRREPDGRSIVGELYEVPVAQRAILDDIEGAPTPFRLEPIAVEGVAGLVFAYLYQPALSGVPRYPGERWANRKGGGSS